MKKSWNILLKSVLTSLGLLLFSYLITNYDVQLSGEGEFIKKAYALKSLLNKNDKPVPDSILYVNICYDKQLINVNDEDGFHKGNIDITNRRTLYDFLGLLSLRSDYKYVFLDVFFEQGLNTDIDSLLFNRIANMERVIIPCHRNAVLADSILKPKAYYSEYTRTAIEDDFMKYELIDGDQKSVALGIYNGVTDRGIKQFGPFYFDGYSLCNHTLFSKQEVWFNSPYDKEGNKNYYNLGADLLSDREGALDLCSGKYIFIGDMELTDLHETVQGELPGTVIASNVFLSLMGGRHRIPLLVIGLLFITYLVAALSVYSNHSVSNIVMNFIKKKCPKLYSPLGVIILSWITYSVFLSIVCLFLYFSVGVSYDIFLTTTLLEGIDFLNGLINKK